MRADEDARATLLRWMGAFRVSRALQLAAELDLAGLIEAGVHDLPTLAARTGSHAPTLFRLLRALASEGIFRERDDGTFENTPVSTGLIERAPGSVRNLFLVMGHESSWRSWEHLRVSVRTGEPAFDHVFGQPFFDYLSGHPEAAALFDRGMEDASGLVNEGIVRNVAFPSTGTVVDVAGGTGSTLLAILAANAGLRGVLMDAPYVAERASTAIAASGLSGRCRFVAGDFFAEVPPAGDVYFLKHILHDWDDQDAARILRTCREAMGPAARLLVCERIVPPGNEPHPVKWTDLQMLVATHRGRERTENEYRALFASGGFGLARVIDTGTSWSVMEGVPR